jgi:hypothetical protein
VLGGGAMLNPMNQGQTAPLVNIPTTQQLCRSKDSVLGFPSAGH